MGPAAQRGGRLVPPQVLPFGAVKANLTARMKPVLTACLAAILAVATGCKQYEEVYGISFRSANAMELANGTISLSGPLPASGTIRGWYKLQLKHVQSSSKEVEIFNQLFTGKESGRVEWLVGQPKSGVTTSNFDFMPGSVDANIVAHAAPTIKGYWKGRWAYALFNGGREGGGFDVARK